MRSFGVWACLTLLSFGIAASCGSSDQNKAVGSGGEDPGAAGDAGGPSGGRAGSTGSSGSANTAGSAGTAGSLAIGGDAGGGGVALNGGASGNAAGEGNFTGQGGAAGHGGAGSVAGAGGAGGAGGAACCSTRVYESGRQLLPDAGCSGWELVNNADTEVPQLLGGFLRLSTSTVGENQYYMVAPEGLRAPPTKLLIEARMQLISGSASAAYRAPANFGFVLNGKKNLLMIADGEIFILSGENSKGASAAVATTNAMHVYRIEVDTALDKVEVLYDGVSKLTGSTFADPNGAPNFLYFGDGSLYGTGVSDWAYFTHNADACAD